MGENRKKSSLDWKYYILLIAAITLVFLSLLLVISKPVNRNVIDVSFSVGDTLGVGFTDKNNLEFGRLLPTNQASRDVIFQNDYGYPVRVEVLAEKDISDYLFVKETYEANTGEKLSIPVIVNIPEDTGFGNYSGKILFRIKKL